MQELNYTTTATESLSIQTDNYPKTDVKTIGEFLLTPSLKIPPYQRPYKWTKKHVNQLVEDLYAHRKKSVYRLGTIITHFDGENLNIVDGQQRVVTFLLLHLAIRNTLNSDLYSDELNNLLKSLVSKAPAPAFKSDISQANIQANYREIERHVRSLDVDTVDFIFNKCEVIQLTLNDVSEAFQFFDSQNSRGKDLEPHDLLKAYHLREFSEKDQHHKKSKVEKWESMDTYQLSMLFGTYLYRVKGWLKDESARFFTKNNTDLFKGINPDNKESYPHTQLLSIIHFFVDGYNNSYERNIDQSKIAFPFQLDQTVIDGRRFFEMVNHYYDLVFNHLKPEELKKHLDESSAEIIDTLESYNGRKRMGDAYARMLFDCALLYYIDKFGYSEISRTVEKLFIWSYSLRLRYQLLSLASADNYVKENNIFKKIQDSIKPKEVLFVELGVIRNQEAISTKSEDLKTQFKKLGYYAEN